jgi:aspartate/methionine/tyrosine aminotransferase
VELIAQRAIENGDLLLEPRRRQAARNREIVAAWMDAHRDHVEWVRPVGGVCAFPRLNDIADEISFCRHLAEAERVLLVPGTCFGCAGHVRLGFGGSTPNLEEGLRRLARALSGYRRNSAKA